MPSPFPGMDPCLGKVGEWKDFHDSFIYNVRRHLVPQVQPAYRATAVSLLFLEKEEEEGETTRRTIYPDNAVLLDGPTNDTHEHSSNGTATAVAEPPVRFCLTEYVETQWHPQVHILDHEGRTLVCAIELLSRSNKEAGRDRDVYEAKRQDVMHNGAHFIEIDLLRTTPRLLPQNGLPPMAYYAMVIRDGRYDEAGLWPIGVRDRLPTIPVPLKAPDADATLDLQAVFDATYDAARYGDYIYRDGPPDPPLEGADADWAAGLLDSAGVAAQR